MDSRVIGLLPLITIAHVSQPLFCAVDLSFFESQCFCDGSSSSWARPWAMSSSIGERVLWTSFSLQFLHFIRRFWNQIFTLSIKRRADGNIVTIINMDKYVNRCFLYACMSFRFRESPLITWDSLRLRSAASLFRSVLLMYFCLRKVLSSSFRCSSENTALLRIPLLDLGLVSADHIRMFATSET